MLRLPATAASWRGRTFRQSGGGPKKGQAVLLTTFDPPANTNDFDSIANQRRAWSDTLNFWFTREVNGVEQLVGAGKSQFYNPHVTDTSTPSASKTISWIGFPQLIANRHLGNHQ